MALTKQEATFVKWVVLQGDKLKAIKEAYPKLEEGDEQEAIRHIMQNPEVQRHIDAGVLYMFKDIVTHAIVKEPEPLSFDEQCELLRLTINGERSEAKYVVTQEGLRIKFVPPDDDTRQYALQTLQTLRDNQQRQWF